MRIGHAIYIVFFLFLPAVYSLVTQVHLSYGDSPDQMVVAWSSGEIDTGSVVEYRVSPLGFKVTANGKSRLFVDQGPNKRAQYLHVVLIRKLLPRVIYEYRCGGNHDWSRYYEFQSRDPNPAWVPTIALIGDLSVKYSKNTVKYLKQDAKNRSVDLFLASGDYAYDLHTDDGKLGDEYFEMLESVIARVPILAAPGNHENMYDFLHFRERFENPFKEQTHNFYFSVNVGQIHIVFLNIEWYHPATYNPILIKKQYDWLINDLEEANHPLNRLVHPWIILLEHRSLYCSTPNFLDCKIMPELLRQSRADIGQPLGLEDVLYNYGVDIFLTGHTHNYERTLPVYRHKPLPGLESPYLNPRATVHIVNGAGGAKAANENFTVPIQASAFRAKDYGYNRLRAVNSTHLYLEFVSTEKDGKVIDTLWIVQYNHGSFNEQERKKNTYWQTI